MSAADRVITQAFEYAIYLYPAPFRQQYGPPMQQSVRDALADVDLPRKALLLTLFVDLIRSLVKENLAMLRDTFSRPALLFNAFILMALSTIFSLGLAVLVQQILRQLANDPQLELSANLASRLEHGTAPASAIPDDQIDMDSSLSAFVIAYDEQGRVVGSSAQLNGSVPVLPGGVLDYARSHGVERVTWAPRRDVRIASVVRHVLGGGFVLAGRNLREVEARKALALQSAAVIWLAMLGTVAGGTFIFGWWFSRAPSALAT